MTPKVQGLVSLGMGTIGLGLLAMMIATEGEPGALPLALIVLGAIGYASSRMRSRGSAKRHRLG